MRTVSDEKEEILTNLTIVAWVYACVVRK